MSNWKPQQQIQREKEEEDTFKLVSQLFSRQEQEENENETKMRKKPQCRS